ncbi:sensor histidine kinase [Candidatus Latescibacterota bacterium]
MVFTLYTDSPEERRRKVTLVVITFFCCITGIISGTNNYVISDPIITIIIPYTFSIISGIAIFTYYITKRFAMLLYSFLFLILLIPVLFQWSIGGFTAPGSVTLIFWSILAPFGSLMFQNIRKAMWWFFAYLALLVVSLYLDEYLLQFAGPVVYKELIVGHGINIITLSITIFITMMYFINAFQKEHVRAEKLVINLKVTNSKLETTLEELRNTQAELIQSEKMASLGELTAGIAHEINNPIGAIKSANDLISKFIEKIDECLEDSNTLEDFKNNRSYQKIQKVFKANTGVISEAGSRVSNIVKNLKNFARLDEAEFQIADVREGIDSSLVLLDKMLKDRINIEKEYNDIPEIPCYPGLLNQVFMNLLKNSIEAIKGTGTIRIKTIKQNKEICISFSDNGIGIPADKLEKIFDLGFSADQSKAKMGFGLSTAYNIIQKHNGRFEVKSEEQKGTTFSIFLPIK